MHRLLPVAMLSLLLTLPLAASAGQKQSKAMEELRPQILEEIDLMKKAVNDGDIPAALDSNQLVDAWLRQIQAQSASDVFIDIPGWEKELGESQAISGTVLGGGVTSSCTFRKGDVEVTLDVVGNSSMISMVSGMMGMAVLSGKQVVKINGNKALVDDQGNRVEIQVPVGGVALVTGRGPTKEDTLHVTKNGVSWDTIGEIMGQ